MIIGIDETGDFSTSKYGIFVATYLRASEIQNITTEFRNWEKIVRSRISTVTNEIKSSHLSEEDYTDFVTNIVFSNKFEPIRYEAIGIEINKDTNRYAELQQQNYSQSMKVAVNEYRTMGQLKMANQYNNLREWYEALNPSEILKLEVLGLLIVESINNSIRISATNGFDEELGKLSFKIDESFISISNQVKRAFWLDLLRNQLWSHSYRHRIIRVNEWDESHPFERTFIDRTDRNNGVSVLKQEFKNRINIVRSGGSIEVRISDIIAGMYKNKFNMGGASSSFAKLQNANVLSNSLKLLKPTNKNPNLPNPFDL